MGLVSRGQEDWMRQVSLRLDQIDRNMSLGFAVPWTPVVSMTGVACTQGANYGYWTRLNDVFIGWFAVTIGATAGTGTLLISLPEMASTPIELDTFSGFGVRNDYGHWHYRDSGSTNEAEGWIESYSVDPTKIYLITRMSAPPVGASSVVTDVVPGLTTGDRIWGHILAKVADP